VVNLFVEKTFSKKSSNIWIASLFSLFGAGS
jgi:hypothetical protein